LTDAQAQTLGRAALLHDLGRAGLMARCKRFQRAMCAALRSSAAA